MKPFVFKLETLLEIRKRREEEANIKLSQAQTVLKTAKEKLEQLQNQQIESFEEFRIKQSIGEIFVTECQIWARFFDFLKKAIENQEIVVEEAKRLVLIALREVEEAMKNRRAVEKLKEKRLEQYNKELQEEEQKNLDEIAVTRHGRTKREEL